jgi:cytochrome c551/c552
MIVRATRSDAVEVAGRSPPCLPYSTERCARFRALAAAIGVLLAVGCAPLPVVSSGPVVDARLVKVSPTDVPALLRAKGCHACHAPSETLLGPSYAAIATMHGARSDVMVDVLAEKIVSGGAGNWGVAPMPRNDRVSRAEARAMAAWILAEGAGR